MQFTFLFRAIDYSPHFSSSHVYNLYSTVFTVITIKTPFHCFNFFSAFPSGFFLFFLSTTFAGVVIMLNGVEPKSNGVGSLQLYWLSSSLSIARNRSTPMWQKKIMLRKRRQSLRYIIHFTFSLMSFKTAKEKTKTSVIKYIEIML